MLNHEKWQKILQFQLDSPSDIYGFTLRLANENSWTKHFTALAILEYKKFMYLAATGEGMVSPSEVVDAVWHLHLIFTESYEHFCQVLGKTSNIFHPHTTEMNQPDSMKPESEPNSYMNRHLARSQVPFGDLAKSWIV